MAGDRVQPNRLRCRAWEGSRSGGQQREEVAGFRFTTYPCRVAAKSVGFEAQEVGRRQRPPAQEP